VDIDQVLWLVNEQVAFVAGVADASGYGWAIAKQLANAGATIIVGTWPPVMTLFERGLKKGFGEDGKLLDGTDLKIDKVYPLDGESATGESPTHGEQDCGHVTFR
jgi:enoyl-[acyl-carrier protein] reductase I